MLAYLSEAWVEALDAALSAAGRRVGDEPADHERLADRGGPGATSPAVVQYRVVDGPQGERMWHLVLEGGRATARPGPAQGASVTLTQPWPVAVAIARGERSASAAVLRGDISISGDPTTLLPWRETMRGAGHAVARLAAETDFSGGHRGADEGN
jgi:hypothetical protein